MIPSRWFIVHWRPGPVDGCFAEYMTAAGGGGGQVAGCSGKAEWADGGLEWQMAAKDCCLVWPAGWRKSPFLLVDGLILVDISINDNVIFVVVIAGVITG